MPHRLINEAGFREIKEILQLIHGRRGGAIEMLIQRYDAIHNILIQLPKDQPFFNPLHLWPHVSLFMGF